jgi:hypothetical protein
LRRPLQKADASFSLQNTGGKKTATGGAQLVLNIDWPAAMSAQDINPPKDRPAIRKGTSGQLLISPDTSTAHHVITSEYIGHWDRFVREFEPPFTISIPLRYSLPPFPSLALVQSVVIQYLPAVDYQTLSQIGKQEGWQEVAARFQDTINKQSSSENREELLLLYGESLMRAGKFDQAHEIHQKLAEGLRGTSTGEIARYLSIHALASSGKPYDAAYELSFMQQQIRSDHPLRPFLELLQLEIAIATDNIDKARQLLHAVEGHYQEKQQPLFHLRLADVLYASNRPEEALAYYKEMAADTALFAEHPSSRAKYGTILYQNHDYDSALKQFINLASILQGKPGKELALFAAAMCQYNNHKTTEAGLMFEEIIKDYPDTEAWYRARLKTNDMFVLAELDKKKESAAQEQALKHESTTPPEHDAAPADSEPASEDKALFFEQFDAARIYEEIAASAPLREIRAEAAFKQALAKYFFNNCQTSIELLEKYIRANANGLLVREAEALLVELLPTEIQKKIEEQDYVKALAMAEKNRPLLVAGNVSGDFLAELGLAFASLLFWNRAARVYLYMLDIAKDKSEEEQVLLPLAFYEKNDFVQAEEYCKRYLKNFPDGGNLAAITQVYLQALHKNNRSAEAIRFLKKEKMPADRDLYVLAGRICFESGEYDLAEKYLATIGNSEQEAVEPEEILLRAEGLFRNGHGDKALKLYHRLEDFDAFRDQALYRSAQVQLASNNQDEGLKLLQRLVEKANSPLWRKMATETLAIEKL